MQFCLEYSVSGSSDADISGPDGAISAAGAKAECGEISCIQYRFEDVLIIWILISDPQQ